MQQRPGGLPGGVNPLVPPQQNSLGGNRKNTMVGMGMGSDVTALGMFGQPFMNMEDLDMFKPEGEINFEREFGQWFNGPGVSGLESTTPVQQSPPPPPPQQTSLGGSMMNTMVGIPTSMGNDITDLGMFGQSFMNIEDLELFKPEGDINFEREFGQWFNGPEDGGSSGLESMK